MPPRPSPRKSVDRIASLDPETLLERERISAALLDLCLEHGYRNLTVAIVADRAGVGEEGFHRHFADLEDCFCWQLEAERDALFARAERALAGQSEWVDRLRTTAYTLLRFLQEDRRRTHFLTTELQGAGERPLLIWSETIAKPLFALLDQGRGEAPERPPPSQSTAAAVGGGIFAQISAAAARETLDERAVPQLMYAAVLPYLGPEAARRELERPPQP